MRDFNECWYSSYPLHMQRWFYRWRKIILNGITDARVLRHFHQRGVWPELKYWSKGLVYVYMDMYIKKVIYKRKCIGILAAYAAVNKAILSTLHIHRTRNPNHLTKHVFCNFAIRELDSKQIYSCNMSIWQNSHYFSSPINSLLLRVFVSLPM